MSFQIQSEICPSTSLRASRASSRDEISGTYLQLIDDVSHPRQAVDQLVAARQERRDVEPERLCGVQFGLRRCSRAGDPTHGDAVLLPDPRVGNWKIAGQQ